MRTDATFLAIEKVMAGIDDAALAGLDVAELRVATGGLADGATDGWLGNARAVMLRRRLQAADQAVFDDVTAAVRSHWPAASVSVGGGQVTVRRDPTTVAAVPEGVDDVE